MYCIECGEKLGPTNKFCWNCGVAVNREEGIYVIMLDLL